MDLWRVPATDVRAVLTGERSELLEWLDDLTPAEWRVPTAAPGWTVKDLALHLLDDDLGLLSRDRDGDRSGLLDTAVHGTFVAALAAKNEAWVRGAHQLSARVICGLLQWAGKEMDDYYAGMDLYGEGRVVWASDGPVPLWFDIAQDLTERWVHQMQMRLAVDKVGGYATAHLPDVLRTFVWAFPNHYCAAAPAGTRVVLELAAGDTWTLTGNGAGRWELDPGAPAEPAAGVYATDDAGWRWLTGAAVPHGGLRTDGPEHLVGPLLEVRASSSDRCLVAPRVDPLQLAQEAPARCSGPPIPPQRLSSGILVA